MLKRIPLVLMVLALTAGVGDDALAQTRPVTGTVTSVTGEPIAGATITVKGTTITALSDEQGNFTINVPRREVTLVIAFLGYRTQEVTVPSDRRRVDVNLELDPLRLEELVVTGRATEVRRRNLANAITTVSAEEVDRAPAASVEKALQAKVPGANIQTNSGAPGGGVQVQLRGPSTINALAQPLYVVDGVIISNEAIPSNQNAVTEASTGSNPSLDQDALVNRVVDLAPEDIESIEVLKGASAAAIYGQKASNGVIVITTKRGQPGRARVRYSQRFGFFDLSNTLGSRRFETVDEAVAAFGDEAADFFGPDGRPLATFDQEELLADRNDLSTESRLSVSGGTTNTRYFASGTWKNDEGIIPNTGFEKQSLRANIQQLFGDRAELTVTTNVIHTLAQRGLTNNDNSGTSFYMVFPFTPEFVDLRERPGATGKCAGPAPCRFPQNPFERSNPLQTAALMTNDEDVWRFIGGISGSYDLIQGQNHSLRLLSNLGVDFFNQENELLFPPELEFEPNDGLPGTSLLSNSNNLNLNVGVNAVHTYTPTDAAWSLTTSAGFQYEDRDLEISRIISRNLNAAQPNVNFGTNISVREERQRVKESGFYLQEELLAVNDRLLLTAGGRFDRSSNIGDHEEFFFYPKASASYRFPNLTGEGDELKLRVAWGQSGNLPLFGQKFSPLQGDQNANGIPSLVVSDTLGNADVKPERQNEIEGGFDLTLFDGRASVEFTVYQKNITDMLLARELALSSGFVAEIFNGGELRVRGIEAAVAATPVRTDRVSWVARSTFSLDRSKVLDLPIPSFRTGGFGTALGAFQIQEGESATQIVAVISEGDSSFVAKVGDATPDFRVGFSNDLTFGAFNLYTMWDWQAGSEVINLTKLLYDFGANTEDYDEDPRFVDNIGPVEVGDTLTAGERRVTGFGVETRPYIESGTFLKLRELSGSYTLPGDLVGRLFGGRVESVRFTVAARNLLTFTGYDGLDPEVSNFGNQSIARNVDVAPFPPSRSFWFGFDVTF